MSDTVKLDNVVITAMSNNNAEITQALPTLDSVPVQESSLPTLTFFDTLTQDIDSLVIDKPIQKFKTANEYEPENLLWLAEKWFALGTHVYVVGKPGTGKSQLFTKLMACVTRGHKFNDIDVAQGGVVFVSLEDSIENTLLTRLEAYDADTSKIIPLSKVTDETVKLPNVQSDRDFSLPEDIGVLAQAIKQINAKLVIIDTLERCCKAFKNDMAMQPIMLALRSLAENLGVCIVSLGHFNKGKYNEQNIGAAIGGATIVQGISRGVYTVLPDATNPKISVLQMYKCNIGPIQDPMPYCLAKDLKGRPVITFDTSKADNTLLSIATQKDTENKTFKRIAQCIYQQNRNLDPSDIAQLCDIPHATVRQYVRRMLERGLLVQEGYGSYNIPVQYRQKVVIEDVTPKQIEASSTSGTSPTIESVQDNVLTAIIP